MTHFGQEGSRPAFLALMALVLNMFGLPIMSRIDLLKGNGYEKYTAYC